MEGWHTRALVHETATVLEVHTPTSRNKRDQLVDSSRAVEFNATCHLLQAHEVILYLSVVSYQAWI
jgi:hypothetical protein